MLFAIFFLFSFSLCCEYQNPVFPGGADPWVTFHNSSYYFTHTVNGKTFFVTKTNRLEALSEAETVFQYTPPSGLDYSGNLWAPEIHFLFGKWYIYFAAGKGDIPSQRMHVLEGKGELIEDGFRYKAKLNLPEDQYSIDGTVISLHGSHYFVWSGWPNEQTQVQNLYISKMTSGFSVVESTKRSMISTPEYEWETCSGKINEGPEQLRSPQNTNYIIYSATSSLTDNYCLGLLELIDPSHPLLMSSWKKYSEPVFKKSSQVFGVGHASFVPSPSKSEDWMVYHSAKCEGCGWDRWINIQQFKWKNHNFPVFGPPIPPHVKNYTCPY